MQVYLYENSKICSSYARDLHHLSTKPFQVDLSYGVDLSIYKKDEMFDSIDKRFHRDRALEASNVNVKTYSTLFGSLLSDYHHELCKLNVLRGFDQYVTVISLEDSLDYILHSICGCDISAVRNIPNYFDLSRGLLKLNTEEFMNFSMGSFIDIDPELNKYLISLEAKAAKSLEEEDDEEELTDINQKVLTYFIKDITERSDTINKYLGYWYKRERPDTTVVKSKSLCSFILSSKEKYVHPLTLSTADKCDYDIMIRSFERYEYAENISLRYCSEVE